MGLVYETSKWCDRLWQEHLESSEHGRELVKEGVAKQGDPFARFPADLLARLYLPTEPRRFACEAPEWATRLHDMCLELGEWHQLRAMTARNGFAAGIAAEVMLEMLLPHVPDRPDAQANRHAGDNGAPPHTDTPKEADLSNSELRAAIRRASRKAKREVEDAERCIEGMGPGVGSGSRGRMNLRAVREAHNMLRNSPMMKKVAMLAGRFERIARGKSRSKVQPGIGEVHGVEMGGNISRLLPAELVALKLPVLKRQLWAKLMEQRVLTYAMQGREPQAKGPVIILLDESGSMRDAGRDIWSKAVTLAMLNRVTQEKRRVHIVGFNSKITGEESFSPGGVTLHGIESALGRRCSGGTKITKAMTRAIEILEKDQSMKQADVMIITDGEDTVEPDVVEKAKALTATNGVSWFVVAVGSDAVQVAPQTLGGFATSMHLVRQTEDADVADIINLERPKVA